MTLSTVKMRVIGLLAVAALFCGEEKSEAASGLSLEPIYRLKVSNDVQRFTSRLEPEFSKQKSDIEGVAFQAVCTNQWLPGLVPVFIVEKSGQFELRRRPLRGQENSTEPLFFALPLEDETDAARLTGRWECNAIRGNNTRADMGWELTMDGTNVLGRFDQYSEYRYAFMAGGTFQSNRLELKVEYISDVYMILGEWRNGQLIGTWHQNADGEKGTWKAYRDIAVTISTNGAAALYEFRNGAARRYALENQKPGPGWERGLRPLCRVWK